MSKKTKVDNYPIPQKSFLIIGNTDTVNYTKSVNANNSLYSGSNGFCYVNKDTQKVIADKNFKRGDVITLACGDLQTYDTLCDTAGKDQETGFYTCFYGTSLKDNEVYAVLRSEYMDTDTSNTFTDAQIAGYSINENLKAPNCQFIPYYNMLVEGTFYKF